MTKLLVLACAAMLAVFSVASTAGAETLTELARRTHFHGLAVARAGTAKLLLATHHGVYALGESGEAALVSRRQDFMGFSADPADPLVYYASGHPAGGGNLGFLKSSDGGATWTQVSEGADGPVDFHQMDVSSADPRTVYGVYGALQVSKVSGRSWAITGAVPRGLIAIAASSLNADRVFAATRAGLFLSEDQGRSWQPAAFEGLPVSLVKAGPSGVLHAFVVGQGLMKAEENALASWTPLANGFGASIPLYLAADPGDATQLYLATQDNQVLFSADGGTSWKTFGAP